MRDEPRLGIHFLLIFDLGCQVEANVAHLCNLVLYNHRQLRRKADGHSFRQRGCLGERVHVSQSKGQGNRFIHLYDGRLLWLFKIISENETRTTSRVTG